MKKVFAKRKHQSIDIGLSTHRIIDNEFSRIENEAKHLFLFNFVTVSTVVHARARVLSTFQLGRKTTWNLKHFNWKGNKKETKKAQQKKALNDFWCSFLSIVWILKFSSTAKQLKLKTLFALRQICFFIRNIAFASDL